MILIPGSATLQVSLIPDFMSVYLGLNYGKSMSKQVCNLCCFCLVSFSLEFVEKVHSWMTHLSKVRSNTCNSQTSVILRWKHANIVQILQSLLKPNWWSPSLQQRFVHVLRNLVAMLIVLSVSSFKTRSCEHYNDRGLLILNIFGLDYFIYSTVAMI